MKLRLERKAAEGAKKTAFDCVGLYCKVAELAFLSVNDDANFDLSKCIDKAPPNNLDDSLLDLISLV